MESMFPMSCPVCGHNKKINDPAPCVCIYQRKPCQKFRWTQDFVKPFVAAII